MKIQVCIKNVYGNERIYPVDDGAKRFADLTRKSTLDKRDLRLIEALGFEVELVNAYTLEAR
jgi:hypothetical protein